MPKFFLEKDIDGTNGEIRITGNDMHHMKDVLRIRTGEEIRVGDPSGRSFSCELVSYGPDSARLQITGCLDARAEPDHGITVYQGLPKADKMEQIIRKCTELGARKIVPVVCARSVARFRDDADARRKIERWSKIAKEAAQQSGRDVVPEVGEPADFREAVEAMCGADIGFLPWESEDALSLKRFLRSNTGPGEGKPGTIAFLIGPEGGFDLDEIRQARDAGIASVTLGSRILRTETAAPAVLAMLLYEFEMEPA